MRTFLSILFLISGIACQAQKSIIRDHIALEVSTFEQDGKTRASAMPVIKKESELFRYKRRFDYLLMNVPEFHSPKQIEERNKLWQLYPDTVELKRSCFNKYADDKKLVGYFEETALFVTKPDMPRKNSFTEDELMEVASKFFYCDKVLPDSNVQAHVCIGLNGIKEASWNKDCTLLEAFCYEGIFNDLDKDSSQVWDSFGALKKESVKKYNAEIGLLDVYLEKVKLDVFERMENNAILKKELLSYYELNKNNLAFKVVKN